MHLENFFPQTARDNATTSSSSIVVNYLYQMINQARPQVTTAEKGIQQAKGFPRCTSYTCIYVMSTQRHKRGSTVVPQIMDLNSVKAKLQKLLLRIECVHPRDQKLYLHNESKGGICTKIEFNPQNNISLLQHGRHFFVYSSNMAAVTSCKHTI